MGRAVASTTRRPAGGYEIAPGSSERDSKPRPDGLHPADQRGLDCRVSTPLNVQGLYQPAILRCRAVRILGNPLLGAELLDDLEEREAGLVQRTGACHAYRNVFDVHQQSPCTERDPGGKGLQAGW